jgi:hypothetical protein
VSKNDVKALLSTPSSVRTQYYEYQINYHGLKCSKRTLQRRLQQYNVRRYKQAIVKEISKKNEAARVKYGEKHKRKTIKEFWQYVFFTDEAHIDPLEIQ